MSGRDWTTNEVRRMLALVRDGTPLDLIAAELGRSEVSVASKFSIMRQCGQVPREWRIHKSKLVTCPECGERRTKLLSNGREMCQVCCDEQTLERNVRWRLEAYDALDPRDKAKVGIGMPECGNIPKPRYPTLTGLVGAERGRAIDAYHVEIENWEHKILTREINALKQRTACFRRMASERKEE